MSSIIEEKKYKRLLFLRLNQSVGLGFLRTHVLAHYTILRQKGYSN